MFAPPSSGFSASSFASALSISASPFGKALAEFFRNALNLKIAARPVANPIAESLQVTGEFVVIDVLGKLPRPQQFVILKCLPAIFHRIEGRVENNAMRVQMRVKGARSVVGEQGGDKIAREPVALRATNANASRRKCLEFLQRRPHRPRMSLKNPLVIAQESREGNRFRR